MKTTEEIISEVTESSQPGYLYFESELILSAQTLRKFWNLISPPGFRLLFSVKANPNPHLLKSLKPFVDGFDVSSLAEAELLLKTGLPGQMLTWSGPAKTDLAISKMIKAEIGCVHIDSIDELKALVAAEKKLSKTVKKSLRLQMNESTNRKLGFSKTELQMLKDFKNIQFSGMHCYLGRESFNLENLQSFIEYTNEIKSQLNTTEDFKLYLGPGLPSRPIIESEFLTQKWNVSVDAAIHLECGRALTQSAGYYFTKILAIKKSEESLRLIIDGGLQHTASHFKSPRFQRQALEVMFFRNGQKLKLGQNKAIIHGSLSIWYDNLLDEVLVPDDLKRGDTIVFNQCGAYGYSAACNQFIGPTQIKEWFTTADGNILDISPEYLKAYQNEL